MYLGRIVEEGPAARASRAALATRTRGRCSRAREAGEAPRSTSRRRSAGEMPSTWDIPSGCRFHTRCALREKLGRPTACETTEPPRARRSAPTMSRPATSPNDARVTRPIRARRPGEGHLMARASRTTGRRRFRNARRRRQISASWLGSPPEPGQLVTTASWQEGPKNRWAFQHVGELVPSAVVSRGSRAGAPARPRPRRISRVSRSKEWSAARRSRHSSRRPTPTDSSSCGDGKILYEQYFNGMRCRRPATCSCPISKSMCGVLAGALVESGIVDLGATVSTYVPELWDSALRRCDGRALARHDSVARVQRGLRRSRLRGPGPGSRRGLAAHAGWRIRRTRTLFLRSLRRKGPHGRAFQYCSATTDVLAWVLERADRASLSRASRGRLLVERSAPSTTP